MTTTAKTETDALKAALRNLAHEMRFLLRANPSKDGGLYRQRLDEAESLLACPHNCDVGGTCLAEHVGFPNSCPALSKAGGAK